jgi:hypothetical protein
MCTSWHINCVSCTSVYILIFQNYFRDVYFLFYFFLINKINFVFVFFFSIEGNLKAHLMLICRIQN